MERCEISIVMAVYNGEAYLRRALDSIAAQTFRAFEVILIDDASTDSTPEILADYAARDARMKVFRNEENLRLARSLNRGVGLACGKYIVRTDADDICLPDRLEKQLAYMESHPDVDVSFCKFFTLQNGRILPCLVGRACDADSVGAMFLFFCPVLHPGVIARAEVMRQYAYDPRHTCSEDHDLWTRMLCGGAKIACSGDYLMLYRLHERQITATVTETHKREVLESERAFYAATLTPMTEAQEDFYMNDLYFRTRYDKKQTYRFYRYICKSNKKARRFSRQAITCAMLEVLAEYRRAFHLGTVDTAAFLRFGGVRVLRALCARRQQSAVDLANAARAAAAVGLVRQSPNGEFPVYVKDDAHA